MGFISLDNNTTSNDKRIRCCKKLYLNLWSYQIHLSLPSLPGRMVSYHLMWASLFFLMMSCSKLIENIYIWKAGPDNVVNMTLQPLLNLLIVMIWLWKVKLLNKQGEPRSRLLYKDVTISLYLQAKTNKRCLQDRWTPLIWSCLKYCGSCPRCRLALKYYQSKRGEMKTKPRGREGGACQKRC